AVTPALPGDYDEIVGILKGVGLPTDGVKEHLAHFLVLRDQGTIIGCVGLEIYDEVAVLRSLAVISSQLSEGLGLRLADRAVDQARQLGGRRLYLLTEAATDFFAQHCGFVLIDRARVEAPANQSGQFSLGACTSATCMRRAL